MRLNRLIVCVVMLTCPVISAAEDAWPLYKRAGERIREGDRLGKSSPAASALEYPGYPPFGAEWDRMAKAAYEFNAEALADVRRATSMKTANWPVEKVDGEIQLKYLNELRNVANQVGDAALYEHLNGNSTAAIARVHDLLHLTDLLQAPADRLTVQSLVAVGIQALALNRLAMINAGARIADRPTPGENVIAKAEIESLIKRLFTNDTDQSKRVAALVATERALTPSAFSEPTHIERLRVTLQRSQTERNLIAMALAAKLFQHQHQRWPASIEELSKVMPAAPLDAHGPMGYALLKGSRPDGGDRPLVYSRAGVPADGKPAYPVAEPQYSYYVAGLPGKSSPGQFRDVTVWPGKPEAAPDGMKFKAIE